MTQSGHGGARPEDASTGTPPRFARLAVLVPILVVLVAYAESPLGGFVWDDHALIEEQELVTSAAPIGEYFNRLFWSDPFEVSSSFYRPLVTLSYAVEYQLWNGSPSGFHVTNVLLHLVVTLFVFALIRRRGGAWPAALGAGLFGAAPRLTESVAWISGRTDVLATLFGFAALWLWIRPPETRWLRLSASIALLLGLLSKEVAAAFIVGIAAFEFLRWREERDGRRFGEAIGFLVLPVGVYAAMRLRAASLDTRALQVVEDVGLPWAERWPAAFATLGHYTRMVLDPWWPETQIGRLGEHPGSLLLLGGIAFLLSIALLFALYRSGCDEALMFVVIGGVAIAMVLHLVPLALNVLAADRFLYVPLASFTIAAASAVGRWGRLQHRGLTLSALMGALVLSFVVATRERVRDWSDEVRFWRQAHAEAGPSDFMGASQLAGLLMEQDRWEEALFFLRDAERRYGSPGNLIIWSNIALCLDRTGRRNEAIDLLTQVKRDHPEHQRSRFNLVMAYLREGQFESAVDELDALAEALPESPLVDELRGVVLRSARRWEELGPWSEGEALERTARRAQYFENIGAMPEARSQWLRVLGSSAATLPMREQATGFLAFRGTLSEGRWAAEAFIEAGGDPEKARELLLVIEERARY